LTGEAASEGNTTAGERAGLRLLVAEDHALVREGTRNILNADPDMSVVGEAADGVEAVALASDLQPDVAILDIEMPNMDGIEAARRIRTASPDTAVLMLTAYDDDAYILGVLETGAAGYVLKNAPGAALLEAVRAAASGESVLSPGIQRRVVGILARRRKQEASQIQLSDRELEVLRLAAEGLANKEIAANLVLSPRTVQSHLRHIMNKLKVTSRVEAVVVAIRSGWIRAEELEMSGEGKRD
jgi:two-component system, NarL family, response regulator LiaR